MNQVRILNVYKYILNCSDITIFWNIIAPMIVNYCQKVLWLEIEF